MSVKLSIGTYAENTILCHYEPIDAITFDRSSVASASGTIDDNEKLGCKLSLDTGRSNLIDGHTNLKAVYLRWGHITDKMELASVDRVAASIGDRREILDETQI
ncbi:MAG: hypothetical protein ACRC62_25010 [Microcoleus sp.]